MCFSKMPEDQGQKAMDKLNMAKPGQCNTMRWWATAFKACATLIAHGVGSHKAPCCLSNDFGPVF